MCFHDAGRVLAFLYMQDNTMMDIGCLLASACLYGTLCSWVALALLLPHPTSCSPPWIPSAHFGLPSVTLFPVHFISYPVCNTFYNCRLAWERLFCATLYIFFLWCDFEKRNVRISFWWNILCHAEPASSYHEWWNHLAHFVKFTNFSPILNQAWLEGESACVSDGGGTIYIRGYNRVTHLPRVAPYI